MGPTQEPAGHELRQAVQVHSPILQEGHHEEAGQATAARLPVLLALLPLKPLQTRLDWF